MMVFIMMFYLIVLVLLLFLMFMYFMIFKISFYMEFMIVELYSMKLEFLIFFDWISILFSSVVLFISTMVILYSLEYMSNDLNINRFIILILLFVLSMMFLIFLPNMVSILLGWDGLGLVSYCLVIYYQSKNSFNSGMVTVLINRLGDIFILISISLFIMLGSWNYMFLNNIDMMIYFTLMLASFTKSAQVPFSSWLPLAMAAPTPVSSLVHSSTLVTAGVYLLIRMNYLLEDKLIINIMMLISVLTMFLSGLGANFEFDLKKIIALSTLSQLGIMIFSLSMNQSQISLFHLLTHAMFKSMLFMCAGVIIHNMLNNQDIRLISMTMFNLPLVSLMFNCSSMSLCGIPFLSGFFSKDLILEMYMMSLYNKFMFCMLFISMGFTVSYSIRLMYYSFIKVPMLSVYNKFLSFSSKMVMSMYLLFFMSILKGLILSWIMFSMKNMIYLTYMFKMLIYFFMLMGGMIGYLFKDLVLNKIMIGVYNNYIKFFMILWFMPIMYMKVVQKFILFSSDLNFYIDCNWLEFMGGGFKYMFFMNIFKLDFYFKNYFYLIILFMIMMIFIF